MTRTLPIGFLVSAFTFTGCTGGDVSKTDGSKKDNPITKERGKENEDHKYYKDAHVQSQPVEPEPDFTLTGEELAKEFARSEETAITKYDGKLLAVTDTFLGFERTNEDALLGRIVITRREYSKNFAINGSREPRSSFGHHFSCWVPTDKVWQVCRLSIGQKVKTVGKMHETVGMTIRVQSVTEIDKSKFVVVPSIEIAKEFEKDQEAAANKYFGYEREGRLGLSGQIEDLTVGPNFDGRGKVHMAKLSGSGKTTVSLTMEEYIWKTLKKGQSAEFRGDSLALDKKDEVILTGAWLLPAK